MTGRWLRSKPFSIPPSHVATRQSTDVLAVDDGDVAQAIGSSGRAPARGFASPRWLPEWDCRDGFWSGVFGNGWDVLPKAEILRVQIEAAKILLTAERLSIEALPGSAAALR